MPFTGMNKNGVFFPLFQDFCYHLFRLFDTEGNGFLIQDEWIAMLKENCR